MTASIEHPALMHRINSDDGLPASHITSKSGSPRNDPRRFGPVEPQAFQSREDGGQRDVRRHRARGKGAGAIMRPGAERDAFGGI
jgi:hypothetical protein